MNYRNFIRVFLLVSFFLCSFSHRIKAQDFDATFQLRIYNKYDKTESTEVAWCNIFSSTEKANSVVRQIKQSMSNNPLDYDEKKVKAQAKLVREVFKKNKCSRTGEITYPVAPGMAVVFMTADYDGFKIFTVKAGQNYYSDTVGVSRIPENVHKGKRKKVKYDEVSVIDYGDGYERFKISIDLPEGLAKDDSRLIFQVSAVDCQTEDTVAYLQPKVFEGEEYHKQQIKRKGYDFFKNDSLAAGYDPSDTLRGGKEMNISTVILYKKPDKTRQYRGPFTCSIEDFHHSYYRKDNPGTCLRKQPLKFLDFSVAGASLELDRDKYYMEPRIGRDSVQLNYNFEFQVGKAELKADSVESYTRQLSDLSYDLSQLELLVAADLMVYNSPEGGQAINAPLAQRRAERAASLIHMPRGKHLTVRSHVFTWEETAAELEKRGEHAAAKAILDTLALAGKDWRTQDKMMKGLSMYESVILPEMERERKMTFTYSTLREKQKTPTEAVDAYLSNRKKPLSWGDYFNVFDLLIKKYALHKNEEDSVELERLTRITYDRLMKTPDPLMTVRMAPYLMNQMAVVQNRLVPDTMILKPLLNDTLSVNATLTLDFKTEETITINRPQYILNQSVAFFKLQEIKRAKQMLQMLKQDISSQDDDVKEAVQRLQYFLDFMEQLPNPNRTDEQEELFQKALAFIEESGIDNRAILYTELPDELPLKSGEAEYWVDLMSDDKPQKWYLKGILWAKKVDNQPELDLEDLPVDNSFTLDNDLDINKMGHYLAYFQHSFDSDKSANRNMMRYYFNEGHVEDRIRKKYPYKNAMVPVYRKIFELRKKLDDEGLIDVVDKLEAKGYDLEEMGYGPLLQKIQEQNKTSTAGEASATENPMSETATPVVTTPTEEPKAE